MDDNQTAPTDESHDSRSPSNSPREPHRILVVDDDDAIRELNSQVLIHYGYHVDAAEDGAVAWETLQVSGYDLLVTDNQMPNLSGVQLLEKLWNSRMAIPVIMATGTLPVDSLPCVRLQPAIVLLKPYSPGELLRAVQITLSASAAGAEHIWLDARTPREVSIPKSQTT